MASIRVIGTTPVSFQDWQNQQLWKYAQQNANTNKGIQGLYPELGVRDDVGNLIQWNGFDNSAEGGANPFLQGYGSSAEQDFIRRLNGNYGAIGFSPQTTQQALQGYLNPQVNFGDYKPDQFFRPDASGNMLVPLTAEDDIGHDLFGLSFGGSDGGNIGGMITAIEQGLLSWGGAALTGATSAGAGASSTAGFGEAGYAGAAGGSAGAASGAGYDYGMTGNESGLTGSGGQPVASVSTGGGGGGGAGGGSLDSTGAFDQTASQGVFDSSGNPLYKTQEPGMWDWLDNLDNGDSFDFGNFGVDENSSSASTMSNASEDTGAFDQFGSRVGPDSNETIFGGNDTNPFGDMSLKDIISNYGEKGLNYIKSLIASRSGGAPSSGSGILGGVLNDPLGAAFNATPFLLALNEANKQSSDLNGVLNSINADSYRKAVLDPYDLETGQNRYALQNDLGLRGVAGSSFGNQAIGNYDYTRALWRGDLASKAAVATAGLQGNLINQRNTNRNLLLGAGLNASGKLFSPPQDPFNLRALLGVA